MTPDDPSSKLFKPYRKVVAREPQGVPYAYKDLSKTNNLTEEQISSASSGTTINNFISSTVPDATTTVAGKVILAANGGTTAATVVQGDDTRLIHYSAMQVVFDGNGSALVAGATCDLYIPFGITIISNALLADQAGTCSLDIRKDTYANYPPTGADSIVAAAAPTLTAATKSKDTTLTGWTTALAADTTIQFYLTSTATITRLTCTLYFRKT